MLEEYQAQAQQIDDLLGPAHDLLAELRHKLEQNYPEEERTYRMGKAMSALGVVSVALMEAISSLRSIEWPTEERPRSAT